MTTFGEREKRFVVACGGTGGHVFPGLAVANVLRSRGHQVEVWLSGRDIEQKTLNEWDGPVFRTGTKQLRVRNIFGILGAFGRCRRRIKEFKPDALLAMGSYSSLPPVLAAWMSHVPVVLHEANAVPGKAVDSLSRFAAVTCVSFRDTPVRHGETAWTGLPVRDELILKEPYEDIPEGRFVFFVTGGSQGAHRVNELMSQAFSLLEHDYPQRIFVIHQTGAADKEAVKACYEKSGVSARVQAFFPDMGRAFASANFVIARAGASTCFELALLGKPALLIPLPEAVRDHQRLNAEAIVKVGGADVAKQSEMTGRSIMRYLAGKLRNPAAVGEMAESMKAFSVPDAAERVATIMERKSRSAEEEASPEIDSTGRGNSGDEEKGVS